MDGWPPPAPPPAQPASQHGWQHAHEAMMIQRGYQGHPGYPYQGQAFQQQPQQQGWWRGAMTGVPPPQMWAHQPQQMMQPPPPTGAQPPPPPPQQQQMVPPPRRDAEMEALLSDPGRVRRTAHTAPARKGAPPAAGGPPIRASWEAARAEVPWPLRDAAGPGLHDPGLLGAGPSPATRAAAAAASAALTALTARAGHPEAPRSGGISTSEQYDPARASAQRDHPVYREQPEKRRETGSGGSGGSSASRAYEAAAREREDRMGPRGREIVGNGKRSRSRSRSCSPEQLRRRRGRSRSRSRDSDQMAPDRGRARRRAHSRSPPAKVPEKCRMCKQPMPANYRGRSSRQCPKWSGHTCYASTLPAAAVAPAAAVDPAAAAAAAEQKLAGVDKLLFFNLPLGKPVNEVKAQLEHALSGYGMKGFEMVKMESDGKGKHVGEALVQFIDAKCARRAHGLINGKPVEGEAAVYQVCFDGQTPADMALAVQTQPTNQIEISNILPSLTTNELGQRFIRYGNIKKAVVSRASSGETVARVTFEEVKGAEKALSAMHNVDYCRRTIRVVYVGSTAAAIDGSPWDPGMGLDGSGDSSAEVKDQAAAAAEAKGLPDDSAPSLWTRARREQAALGNPQSLRELREQAAAAEADRTPTETASVTSPSRSEEEQRESTLATWEKSQKEQERQPEQERSGRDERSSPGAAAVCHFFTSAGGCYYGDACRFRHEDPSVGPADTAVRPVDGDGATLEAAGAESSDELSAAEEEVVVEEPPAVDVALLSIVSADGSSLDSVESLQAWREELSTRIRGPEDAHLKFIEVGGTELTLSEEGFDGVHGPVLKMRLACTSDAALLHAKGLLANLIGTIRTDVMRDDGLRLSSEAKELIEAPADDTAFVIDTVGARDAGASGDDARVSDGAGDEVEVALLKGWARLQRLKTLGAELVAAAAAAGSAAAVQDP